MTGTNTVKVLDSVRARAYTKQWHEKKKEKNKNVNNITEKEREKHQQVKTDSVVIKYRFFSFLVVVLYVLYVFMSTMIATTLMTAGKRQWQQKKKITRSRAKKEREKKRTEIREGMNEVLLLSYKTILLLLPVDRAEVLPRIRV